MITDARDLHQWRVTYHDGTQLPEYDEQRPDGRGFAEVNASQVKAVELDTGHVVIVPDGASPVFFRRRSMELNPNTNETTRKTIHCIGWKKEHDVCYLFVHEDGSTLLTDDLQAV